MRNGLNPWDPTNKARRCIKGPSLDRIERIKKKKEERKKNKHDTRGKRRGVSVPS